MRKCWNCGQPTNDDDLRVCNDPICGRAAISARAKLEESKKARRGYNRQREYMREYWQRPEVKERRRKYRREYMREYEKRPEVRAKKREYAREYYHRPEVKERRRKYNRERYQRLKKLREEE